MRRLAMWGLLVGLTLSTTGCIMVLGVDRSVTDLPGQKKIVQIDDELYLLDLKTNHIRKIDKSSLIHSETTVTTETSEDD